MRLCADCPTDITDRGVRATRCEPCSVAYRRDYFREWKREHAPERKCCDCGDTIQNDKPPNTKRCRACSEAAIRANRRPVHRVDRTKQTPAAPPLADYDMTPQRVIEVDGQQFEVVFGGGEGLSSVGARGSTLVDARGEVRRNGAFVMGGA